MPTIIGQQGFQPSSATACHCPPVIACAYVFVCWCACVRACFNTSPSEQQHEGFCCCFFLFVVVVWGWMATFPVWKPIANCGYHYQIRKGRRCNWQVAWQASCNFLRGLPTLNFSFPCITAPPPQTHKHCCLAFRPVFLFVCTHTHTLD